MVVKSPILRMGTAKDTQRRSVAGSRWHHWAGTAHQARKGSGGAASANSTSPSMTLATTKTAINLTGCVVVAEQITCEDTTLGTLIKSASGSRLRNGESQRRSISICSKHKTTNALSVAQNVDQRNDSLSITIMRQVSHEDCSAKIAILGSDNSMTTLTSCRRQLTTCEPAASFMTQNCAYQRIHGRTVVRRSETQRVPANA